jgi:hypothetical protein
LSFYSSVQIIATNRIQIWFLLNLEDNERDKMLNSRWNSEKEDRVISPGLLARILKKKIMQAYMTGARKI